MPPHQRGGIEWQQVRVLEELANDPRVACLHCCPAEVILENHKTAPAGSVFATGGETTKKVTVSACKSCPPAVKQLLQGKQATISAEAAQKKKRKTEEDAAAALASATAQMKKQLAFNQLC